MLGGDDRGRRLAAALRPISTGGSVVASFSSSVGLLYSPESRQYDWMYGRFQQEEETPYISQEPVATILVIFKHMLPNFLELPYRSLNKILLLVLVITISGRVSSLA